MAAPGAVPASLFHRLCLWILGNIGSGHEVSETSFDIIRSHLRHSARNDRKSVVRGQVKSIHFGFRGHKPVRQNIPEQIGREFGTSMQIIQPDFEFLHPLPLHPYSRESRCAGDPSSANNIIISRNVRDSRRSTSDFDVNREIQRLLCLLSTRFHCRAINSSATALQR